MKKIKILVLSILSFFGFLCFGYCETVDNLVDVLQEGDGSTFTPGYTNFRTVTSNDFGIYCTNFYGVDYPTNDVVEIRYGVSDYNYFGAGSYFSIWSDQLPVTICFRVGNIAVRDTPVNILFNNPNGLDIDVDYQTYRLDVLLDTELPVMSSVDCQSEYDLMPISSVDSLYCQSNGFCTGGLSSLFINDIEHQSAPLIDISIPEEFEWNYTGNNEIFTLDVVGYNTDSDYIAGIINTQKSKPTNQDFNNIVSGVVPLFIPGLVFILLIYFIFRFIKKVF